MKYMIFKKFAVIALLAVSLTSCVGYRSSKRVISANIYPTRVQLNATFDDYKLLGIEEVTVNYKVYLGFINVLNEINSQEPSLRNVNIVNYNGSLLNKRLKRAIFAGLIKHPDAEFIVPLNVVTETEKMFLGKNVKKTLRFKVYKVNDRK
jgi:hypothetical protein